MQRGQVEAPFQLILVVAMLVMVLPITLMLMNNFRDWNCEQRISNSMESLAREIELASALGGGTRTIDVDLSLFGCDRFSVDNFTISVPAEDRCLETCHTPNCRILLATYLDYDNTNALGEPEPSVATAPVCIRIQSNIEMVQTGCELMGYVSIGDAVEEGLHTFVLEKRDFTVYFCEKPQTR